MGVRESIFASKAEKRNYEKLRRTWGEKYVLTHNMPFLNILTMDNLFDFTKVPPNKIELSNIEQSRLKKTSIDYILSDLQDHPLLGIEFDGLQQGISVGMSYVPQKTMDGKFSPWRQQITELKLRVAVGSKFPLFVVGSEYFTYLSEERKLTVIDGLIGEILSSRAANARLAQGLSSQEEAELDALPPEERQPWIDYWGTSIEVESDFQHNPIHKLRWDLHTEFGIQSHSSRSMTVPDMRSLTDPVQWVTALKKVTLYGAEVILHTKHLGDVSATSWLANFAPLGFGVQSVAEDIAFILAIEKLRRINAKRRMD